MGHTNILCRLGGSTQAHLGIGHLAEDQWGLKTKGHWEKKNRQ
jgi:hypothetical protein